VGQEKRVGPSKGKGGKGRRERPGKNVEGRQKERVIASAVSSKQECGKKPA